MLPDGAEPGLALSEFGVAFGERRVLRRVTLRLPVRGMSVIVGPVASGKSTLLRTLAGLNHAQPDLLLSGRADWNGTSLFEPSEPKRARVALVLQKARFFVDSVRENLVSAMPNRGALDVRAQRDAACAVLAEFGLGHLASSLEREVVALSPGEQRRLALVSAIVRDPDLLMADEPTAGIDAADASSIVETLTREARKRSVLFVTHHQDHAQAAGGTTHLLVEGAIEESALTRDFFSAPLSASAQSFVRTGGCIASRLEGHTDAPRARARESVPGSPRGFFWLIPNELGGLPRPGLLSELAADVQGLEHLRIRLLVGLEEEQTVPLASLAAHGIEYRHDPIPDMGVPSVERARAHCLRVERSLALGRAVALHCRAGLGRTGTMLACQLVWRGVSVASAIDRLRRLNPLCIQAECQVDFLRQFGAVVRPSRN
jgi:atypical dual specificity phosphatase